MKTIYKYLINTTLVILYTLLPSCQIDPPSTTLDYTLTVSSANPSMGDVSGGGTFKWGTKTEIKAVPKGGNVFMYWKRENIRPGEWYNASEEFQRELQREIFSDNLLSVEVNYNVNYKAYFHDKPYEVLENEGFMVQVSDLGVTSWSDADKMCKNSKVGGFSDWRLPTLDELMILYNRRNELVGAFEPTLYWSSKEAYGVNFEDGSHWSSYYGYGKYGTPHTRAVRDISSSPSGNQDYIILESEGLMVQKKSLSTTNWQTANNLCKASTAGGYTDWRLPTVAEGAAIYLHKAFSSDFWTSESCSDNYYYNRIYISNGSSNCYYYNYTTDVCAVRTIKK